MAKVKELNEILLGYAKSGNIEISKEELNNIPKEDKTLMVKYLNEGRFIEFMFNITFNSVGIYNVMSGGLNSSIVNCFDIGELDFSYDKDLSDWQPC